MNKFLRKVFLFIFITGFCSLVIADETNTTAVTTEASVQTEATNTATNTEATIPVAAAVSAQPTTQPEASVAVPQETQTQLGNITLDFKDADIRSVLKIISLKAGVNIVSSPDVTGTVTIYLDNVPWDKALDVLLKTYGFGYEKRGNIIAVAPIEKLTEQKKLEQELAQVQPTITEVITLRYIDALDAKKALEPLISKRGRITALQTTGNSGWEFGGGALGKRTKVEKERVSLTKQLLITDIPPVVDQIREVVAKIDVPLKQILIEAKILEVSRSYLNDIGFDYGTGEVGDTVTNVNADHLGHYQVGGQVREGTATILPAVFTPSATGLTPASAGLQLVLQKLTHPGFEVLLHMLEEDVHANLLSAPRIMTLDNQEATILVGEKYPILTTTQSESTTTTQVSLDYYQDIGIQLNVIPQICGQDKISMIIHPAVTSFSQIVGNATTAAYPRIITREAETQVSMNDGETIVIGGLIKDYDNSENLGVPWLSKIPLLGTIFKRRTKDNQKIELLIFLTARIVNENGLTEKEMDFLGQQISSQTQTSK